MNILTYKKIYLGISAILMLVSIVFIFIFPLKLSIEFTGGSIVDFTTTENVDQKTLEERLSKGYDQGYVLRKTEEGYSLRMGGIGEGVTHNVHVLNVLSDNKPETLSIKKFDTIGPTLGSELKTKATTALLLAVIAITLFIAYSFRHVSKPVSSWKYGLITMIALIHDIIITVGFFALFGHVFGIEIDPLFLTALLVILGYSINDTIVVFDRVRENLFNVKEEEREEQFDTVVGKSLSETFVRSLNTSLTTLLSIAIIWYFTTGSVQNFALALLIGITSGTYSSIFVAAPLLTYFKPKEVKE
jgi:preprotein translocase subunit SecF